MQGLKHYFSGIYGSDAMNQFLMSIGLLLLAIASFYQVPFFLGVSLLPIIVAMIRTLSHSKLKRKAENDAFLVYWRPIERRLVLFYTYLQDRGRFQYQTCPQCQQLLRLPKTQKVLNVTCPKCKAKFQVTTSKIK